MAMGSLVMEGVVVRAFAGRVKVSEPKFTGWWSTTARVNCTRLVIPPRPTCRSYREDISSVKDDISSVKDDISSMKADISSIKVEQKRFAVELKGFAMEVKEFAQKLSVWAFVAVIIPSLITLLTAGKNSFIFGLFFRK